MIEAAKITNEAASKDIALREYEIERIVWIDSSARRGWDEMLSDEQADDMEMESAGFVVKETERTVVITNGLSRYSEEGTPQLFNDMMSIPKSAILSRKVLS